MPSTTPCFSMNSVQLLRTWGTTKRRPVCQNITHNSIFVQSLLGATGFNVKNRMILLFDLWAQSVNNKKKYTVKIFKIYFPSLFVVVGWPLTLTYFQHGANRDITCCCLWMTQPIMYARLKAQHQWLCVRDGQTKKEKPQETSATMNHRDILFISVFVCLCVCVCVGDEHGVYKEAPRPHTSFRGWQSGTLAAAAVQTNSTHSKRENKARFEETSWHFAAQRRGQWGWINPLISFL